MFSKKTDNEIREYCQKITTLPPMPPEMNVQPTATKNTVMTATALAAAPTQPTIPTFRRWYVGDQHIHSNWSNNQLDCPYPFNRTCIPSVSSMVNESKKLCFNWVHFTEHAPHVNSSQYWNGNQECIITSWNLSSFKCLYGLE